MKRFSTQIWLVVALVLPFGGRAEEAVSTVRAERPGADGQSVSRIDLEAAKTQSLHLGNLLASAPGALTLDFGGVLATTTVSLRGASPDQNVILLDGVPLGSPAGGGLDLSLVPAALLGGLTVERGSDARFGGGAMGGAVQLTSTRANRVLLTAGSLGTVGASASLSHELQFGEALWTFSAAADARHSVGNFAFDRDPTPELSGNDAPVRMTRVNNDTTLRSLLLRAERRTAGASLDAMLFGTWSERGLPGPIYSTTPQSRQNEKTLTGQMAWRGRMLEVPVSFKLGHLETSNGDASAASGAQSFSDAAVRPTWKLPLGEDWQVGLSGLLGREHFDGTQHGDHDRWRAGAGVELARTRGLVTASGALRVERWESATGVLPRLGGSVRVAQGWTLLGNIGGSFRPPSFGELYYAAGPILANPDLQPERSRSVDVGVRFDRPGTDWRIAGSASVAGSLLDDVIVYELFSGSRAKPFNMGRARTATAELELHGRLMTGPLAGLGGRIFGTLLKAENLVAGANTEGNDLPYRPRTRAGLSLDYERWRRLRVGAGLDWTGASFANRANTRTVDAFADLRASAGVRLFGDLWISAELRNALDQRNRAASRATRCRAASSSQTWPGCPAKRPPDDAVSMACSGSFGMRPRLVSERGGSERRCTGVDRDAPAFVRRRPGADARRSRAAR